MTDNDMQDYDDFAAEDAPLQLPYRGKTYEVEPLDAQTGLRVQRLISAAERASRGKDDPSADAQIVSDAEELDLYPDVLGDVYQELLDDGASYIRLKLAATAAMLWTVYDEDTALEYWAAGGKAPARNREQRRAKTTRTGGASTTKRQGSGSGTSTRRKPSAQQRKAGG